MFADQPTRISMLLLCCAFYPKAALSEPHGARSSFSPNLRAEAERRKAEPTQEPSIKNQEKSLGPGVPMAKTVHAGGHVPVVRGAPGLQGCRQEGLHLLKKIKCHALKLTKVANTPKATATA